MVYVIPTGREQSVTRSLQESRLANNLSRVDIGRRHGKSQGCNTFSMVPSMYTSASHDTVRVEL